MLQRVLLLIALSATLIGCMSDPDATSGAATDSASQALMQPPGGQWRLTELAGAGAVEATEATLSFDGKGGLAGIGGCNRYTGSYEMDGALIRFGPIASTKRACPEPIMNQEIALFAALSGSAELHMRGDELLIVDPETKSSLRWSALQTDATP